MGHNICSRGAAAVAVAIGVAALAGCVAPSPPRTAVRPPGLRSVADRPIRPNPKLEKITIVQVRIPDEFELPAVVGRIQHHRIAAGENLLEVARQSGLGFRELRDANPRIDEWEPKAGVELVVPSRWIVPRATYRGLVVNIPEMRLYLFPTDAQPGERVGVLTWPIGVGAEEAPSPVGTFTVKSKDVNPTWVVPDSIFRTMDEPRHIIPPGPDNPLGDYRIRLSLDLYSIHGTNDPWTVGRLTTHGCIRLYPEDIAELFTLVDRGTPGELVYEPVKLGESGGHVYVEVHQDVYALVPDLEGYARDEIRRAGLGARVDMERLRAAVHEKTGVPIDVTRHADAPVDKVRDDHLAFGAD